MKTSLINKFILLSAVLTFSITASAQIKYTNGRITVGNTQPYGFYQTTLYGNGMYFKCKTNNFFQIDVTPAATRLASHSNEVVFFNTQTSTFNSIQVRNVYNYSDARAKTNIQSLNDGLNVITRLRPVTYDFQDESPSKFSRSANKEIGLLAQEVEAILPSAVITDDEGKKLINYTSLIPVLIQAVQTLQAEVDELKRTR